jgi:hypothetical protein
MELLWKEEMRGMGRLKAGIREGWGRGRKEW